MNFDLVAVDTSAANEGVEMPIRGPDGEPIKNSKGEVPALIVLGLDSEVYRSYQRRTVLARLRIQSTAKAVEKPVEELADDANAEAQKQFCMMTIGWKNFRDSNGAVIPFTKEAVAELFAKYPMVGEQLDTFVATRANFIKRPSKA